MPEKTIREEIVNEFRDDPEVMKWVDSVIEIQLSRIISERANVSLDDLKTLVKMLEEGEEEGREQAIDELNTLIRRREISKKLEGERREKVKTGHVMKNNIQDHKKG